MTNRDSHRQRVEERVIAHLDDQYQPAAIIARLSGLPIQCVGHVLRRLAFRGIVIERVRRDPHPSRWGGESRRYYSLVVKTGTSAWWDLRPK